MNVSPRLLTAAVALAAAVPTAVVLGGTADASRPATAPSARAADTDHPAFDRARFAHPAPNRWFPLTPGLVLRYRGTDDGEHFREVVRVTDRTRVVDGVRARVLTDVLRRADGSLAERTRDWYAADDDGNVWYLGEATATYENGHVDSREGSWEAGVDGARPGLIMTADPRPTDAFRQEYLAGQAEDQAWIVQRGFAVRVPYGRVRHAVRAFEWSRLERNVVSQKVYGPGLGIVSERDVAGGHETFRLVSVHRP